MRSHPRSLAALLGLFLLWGLASPAFAGSASEILAQADALYAQRADLNKAHQSITFYDNALRSDPKNAEAAWKLARSLVWVGNHVMLTEKQAGIFEQAVAAAQRAVDLAPNEPVGYFWLGVSQAVYGQASGIFKSLSLVGPIKENMAKVMEMDPNFEEGGPQRVLGWMYHKLPGLFGGDEEKALEYLRKAVELGPDYGLNQIYLAEVLADMDKKDEARALLQKVLAAKPRPGLEPEQADWRIMAERLKEDL